MHFPAKIPVAENGQETLGFLAILNIPRSFSINRIEMYNVGKVKLKWWKQTSLTGPEIKSCFSGYTMYVYMTC